MNKLQLIYNKILASRIKLKGNVINTNFSVISNNCWGAEIYRELELQYTTPFVGLFLYAPCYIKLLKNFKKAMSSELKFTDKSKYPQHNFNNGKIYPIGILGDDIEIHFMHYKDEAEARDKWQRRTDRINWNNLYFKFCDRDLFSEELLAEFDKLPYENKVCFTSKNFPQYKSNVWIEACKNDATVVDGKELYYLSKRYFDIAVWLNGKSGF